MESFDFVTGSIELLEFVKPLWEKLNKHHEVKTNYFKDSFKGYTFEGKIKKYLNSDLDVKVDLIKDIKKGVYIGYCISLVNKESVGEIDSLFVEDDYRKCGLGEELMNRAIDWLNQNQVKAKIIAVAEGNEKVMDFYKRFGFIQRRIIMEQIKH